MADSVNVYFARLAAQNLSVAVIDSWLDRFGFNQPIPFELPVPPSVATTPDTNLERARMAAGFRHVHLSPLHGAMIAATVANRGEMMRPTLILEVRSPLGGEVLYRHQPSVWRRVISAETADRLTEAMSQTTVSGTASRYFAEREGWPSDLAVAGKTGTLSDRESGLTYSWFVGFGPIDEPQIAVAGLVYNTDRWHIKGAYLASEAIVRYHENQGH
jgi:cell division protein FtsI/penicillin-binding protein 2